MDGNCRVCRGVLLIKSIKRCCSRTVDIVRHIFIINTHAGQRKFSKNLRSELEKIEDFEYFIFNTRGKGTEGALVKKITSYFANETIRFYCCGGSGTFCNVLNSIENLDNVELAFFPCGMTNDFIKVFGNQRSYFNDILNLINGEVRLVDYIETNHGRALNSFSVGMDTRVLKGVERYRPFGTISGGIPYLLSILYSLVGIENSEYKLCIDGINSVHKGFEAFFGNGVYISGNLKFGVIESANNGLGNVWLGPRVNTFSVLPILLNCINGNVEKTMKRGAKVLVASEFSIERTDGKEFSVNFDGEISSPNKCYKARIINKGLKFVVPKQVNIGFEKEDN